PYTTLFRSEVHPFEDSLLGGITLALVELEDPGVAPATLLLRGSDLVEQNLHRVLLVETRGGDATIVKGPVLAERDHLLGDGPRGFGFGQGGGDAFVYDQAADHVGEHRVPVCAGAAQLGSSLKVSHKSLLLIGVKCSGASRSRPRDQNTV